MKTLFEQLGSTYHEENGYRIADLKMLDKEEIGIFGQRHLRYLKEYHRVAYILQRFLPSSKHNNIFGECNIKCVSY